jgi:hypothetical protein
LGASPSELAPNRKEKKGVARETSPVTMCSNELAIKILFNHTQTANPLKSRTEKLDNILHAQGVFRRLNCLDNSFLPRRDKPTTLKLLVYGLYIRGL